jgi:hypothetical protein
VAIVTPDVAVLKGRTEILPWRVGLIAEIESSDSVRKAVQTLTSAWGGIYMPIIDAKSTVDEVKEEVRRFDVDSIYAMESGEGLEELLGAPGYKWTGRGEWGPFEFTKPYSKSLLTWDRLAAQSSLYTGSAPEGTLLWHAMTLPSGTSRPLDVTNTGSPLLKPRHVRWNHADIGLVVLDPDDPEAVVSFWNLRASGMQVHPFVPNVSTPEESLSAVSGLLADRDHNEDPRLGLWGYGDLAPQVEAEVSRLASDAGLTTVHFEFGRDRQEFSFQGIESHLRRDFSVEVPRGVRLAEVPLPQVPLRDRTEYHAGFVRAHVSVNAAENLDPRLTAAVPPYRRHASLLSAPYQADVNDVRSDNDGIALSVEANREYVGYPLPLAVDVMKILFDDQHVTVRQSDEGLFESRAAEMFGPPTGGSLTQPGLRSAIVKAARSTSGIEFPALEAEIVKHRGEWPGAFDPHEDHPKKYAKRLALSLTNSGYLVPMLTLRCPSCGVWESHEVDGLATVNRCEFCGVETKLGLAIGAGRGRWTYRAASRLPESQIRAMMPAVASLSVLHSLMRVEGPPECHVLGLEVALPGRDGVEIDVAAVLHNRDWVTIIGEVKAESSMIDRDDIVKLHAVKTALTAAGVPTIMMFATTASTFSDDEKVLLREYMNDEGASVVSRGGQVFPACPLLFTRPDLSLPTSAAEHPWRWGEDYSMGAFRTALESVRRNLGLENWEISNFESRQKPIYEWSSPEG